MIDFISYYFTIGCHRMISWYQIWHRPNTTWIEWTSWRNSIQSPYPIPLQIWMENKFLERIGKLIWVCYGLYLPKEESILLLWLICLDTTHLLFIWTAYWIARWLSSSGSKKYSRSLWKMVHRLSCRVLTKFILLLYLLEDSERLSKWFLLLEVSAWSIQ